MKQKIFALCVIMLWIISCNLPSLGTPAAPTETPILLPSPTVDSGGVVTLNNVSFKLPLGVANDARSEMVAAATDPNSAPPWDLAPAHLKFTLTGYQLQNRFHEPQIFVYPAEDYASTNRAAVDEIGRLMNLIAGVPLTKETAPGIPSFNATRQIAAHLQMIDFKSGRGVRMVTQYGQYAAPINNRELFYHFQGLTSDGRYYVIAILPVSSSILAEDEKPESAVPAGGVPLPAGATPDEAYYSAVTDALNAMYPDSFNPSLFQLDALIQSIAVLPE